MAEKIIYYLGAGASAQALPLVKDSPNGTAKGMPTTMREMALQVRKENLDATRQTYLNQFADKLEWLAKESEEFTTVDTYAKHLYLTDRHKLEDLKITLSLYFSLEQLWNNKIDKRYLIWLTTILQNVIFPENIKILTWNYDFQIQLTSELFKEESFGHIGVASVHSPPFVGYYPPIGNVFPMSTDQFDPNEFSLIHLNGIAGLFLNEQSNLFHSTFLNRKNEQKDELLNHFIINPQQKKHLLTFAWEKNNTNASSILSKRITFAQSIIKDASIMVIIGYSFPFFNRETDKKIFETLKSSNKLRKIYFQDPFLDGSFLRNQFDLGDIEIEHIKRVDSFFVPLEL